MWFPFDRRDEPPPHAEVFDTNLCDVELPRQLREALASLGVSRLWQLAKHEDQRDFELDLALLDFFPFDLDVVVDELYWTDASFAWLIYASHEDTFTIAGAELLRALQAAWPAWRDFVAK